MNAIKRVSFYHGSGELCDRCGAFIKYVSVIEFVDGHEERFGSSCIEKAIKATDNNELTKYFKRRTKELSRIQRAVDMLSRPVDQLRRGSSYFDSGLFFIADDQGADITWGSGRFFHPLLDAELQAQTEYYFQDDPEAFRAEQEADIQKALPRMKAEIEKIELGLARAFNKCGLKLEEVKS